MEWWNRLVENSYDRCVLEDLPGSRKAYLLYVTDAIAHYKLDIPPEEEMSLTEEPAEDQALLVE